MTNEKNVWNINELYSIPNMYSTDLYAEEGIKSFFYDGLMYQGRVNKVFAYYKAPDGLPPKDGWPAVVLVHGGGGTAFPWMVRKWNDYGYAAISMDLEGHLPYMVVPYDKRPGYDGSGPSRKGIFEDYNLPLCEQWFYHAVADVIRANSLIRSFPEINPEKIGIFGVSWGGIITCVVTGVDQRFKFAIPVYGCGYLDKSDGVLCPTLEQCNLWDPYNFLSKSTIPTLFIDGTNDKHFPLDILQKTIDLVSVLKWQYIKVRMVHSHQPALELDETFAFADIMVKNEKPFLKFGKIEIDDEKVKTEILGKTDIQQAMLCYTLDIGIHSNRAWLEKEAQIDGNIVYSKIPEGTTAFFINVTDIRNFTVSSKYIERPY